MQGKTEGRKRGWTEDKIVDGITDSIDMSLSKLWCWCGSSKPGMLQSMGLQGWTQLSE